jgi:hypothetical protein
VEGLLAITKSITPNARSNRMGIAAVITKTRCRKGTMRYDAERPASAARASRQQRPNCNGRKRLARIRCMVWCAPDMGVN